MRQRRTDGWRGRVAVVALGLVVILSGLSGLTGAWALGRPATAAATGGSGNDGAGSPGGRNQATGQCAVPTAADRAPLSDGTAGSDWFPDLASPVAATAMSAADIDLVARALAACLSSGNYAVIPDLVSGRFLGVLAGTDGQLDPETYLLLAESLPVTPFQIRTLAEIQFIDEDTATADVVYVIANQLFHGRWTFVRVTAGSDATSSDDGGGRWIVDAEQPLEPDLPASAAEVTVTLDEYEIDLTPDEVDGGDALVLAAENEGEVEHEVLVLRVDAGGDVDDLLREPGPALPEGLVFAGQVTVPAGAAVALPLVDLERGTYALVSLLLNDEGVPDLAQGMRAELRIS